MKKCKICGQYFDYHITNAHLESHGITRKEYDAIKGNDTVFTMGKNKRDKNKEDADSYTIDTIRKMKARRNL